MGGGLIRREQPAQCARRRLRSRNSSTTAPIPIPRWVWINRSSTSSSPSVKTRASSISVSALEKSKLAKAGQAKPKPPAAKKDDAAATTPSELYVARDESRTELFFVDKEFVDKLVKEPKDFRDKALAAFQRWDIDVVFLKNSKGEFTFTKTGSSGDWVLGDAKKKTKWDGVSGILDAMEKPVKDFVNNPGPPSTYGLDKPVARVILKQGATVKVDCVFGKEAKDGVYAQIKGESSVKIADKESLEKLNKGESDFLEPPPATTQTESSSSSHQEVTSVLASFDVDEELRVR